MPKPTNVSETAKAAASRAKNAGGVLASALGATPAQAAAMTPKPESETRAAKLEAAIRSCLDDVTGIAATVADVRDNALTPALDKQESVRENTLIRAAKLSRENGFTVAEIEAVKKADLVKAWSAGRNLIPQSIAQYASEITRVMHPSARDHAEQAYTDSRPVWEAERAAAEAAKKAGKECPIPLKAAFVSRYHMVWGHAGVMASHIKADALHPKTGAHLHPDMTHDVASDFAALATAKLAADRVDPRKAAKRVASLAENLAEIAAIFPEVNLASALKALAQVTDARLQQAYETQVRESAPRPAPTPAAPAPKPAAPAPKPASASAPQPAANAAAEAADALLGLLGTDEVRQAMRAALIARKGTMS